jgi:homoserine dehydrogenase
MNELAANDVYSIRSIINGTTNYILTRMAFQRIAFAEALAEAQSLGYAEADPTNDVEGIDAAYKLTVLATLAYGRRFQPEDVYRQGISALEPQDFRYAQEFGYAIKSMAIADLTDSEVQLRVYPALVPSENMLANVNGVYNAVEVHGSLCGQVLFHGMGAGRGPTTSAVLGDLVETARLVRDNATPGVRAICPSGWESAPLMHCGPGTTSGLMWPTGQASWPRSPAPWETRKSA